MYIIRVCNNFTADVLGSPYHQTNSPTFSHHSETCKSHQSKIHCSIHTSRLTVFANNKIWQKGFETKSVLLYYRQCTSLTVNTVCSEVHTLPSTQHTCNPLFISVFIFTLTTLSEHESVLHNPDRSTFYRDLLFVAPVQLARSSPCVCVLQS